MLAVAAFLLSQALWASELSPCEGKLPWKVPAASGEPGEAEVLIVVNEGVDLETIVCHCDGAADSFVTVSTLKNVQTRLYLDACVLVTDSRIKVHNANSEPAFGGFSKYPQPANPEKP